MKLVKKILLWLSWKNNKSIHKNDYLADMEGMYLLNRPHKEK